MAELVINIMVRMCVQEVKSILINFLTPKHNELNLKMGNSLFYILK